MRRRLTRAGFAAAALLAAPMVALASPADLYFERNVMSAAGQRCGLFSPDLASALDSAAAQARGAALRAGTSEQSLAALRQRAVGRAASVACGSKDMAEAAGRVRAAFDGYAKLQSLNFPGDVADWSAQRSTAQRTMVWRLAQTTRFGADAMTFGLAGQGGASGLVAAVSFADGAQPYAARLVLRDVARAGQPCLAGKGLAARMPLPGARAVYLAEARDAAPASLLPRGARSGLAFRFPHAAADALSGLDPREAVAVEFMFQGRGGDMVRTAYVEVGDFAAGRAFLAAAQR
jgi:hypothetical protein